MKIFNFLTTNFPKELTILTNFVDWNTIVCKSYVLRKLPKLLGTRHPNRAHMNKGHSRDEKVDNNNNANSYEP